METTVASNEFYSLKVDVSKNRIYGTFIGFWKTEDIMNGYMQNLQKALRMVRKNFTFVADLQKFSTLPQELVPKQVQSMNLLAQAGLYKVAEVFPQNVLASMQLKMSENKTSMPVRRFASVVEGEKWLDAEVAKL